MKQIVGGFVPFPNPIDRKPEPLKKLYFSVVGPGTIRSNYKYNVAVSIHKANGPCPVKVNIAGPSYNETKIMEIQPMSTTNLEFDIPELERGTYKLTASDTSCNIFESSTELKYAAYMPMVVIQSDKAVYKPDDVVNFRVLFMDENTRPAKVKESIKIVITDGAQNRIKQYNDIELKHGVYTGSLKLSEQPVLGEWLINVLINDETLAEKYFTVDKYVLPLFEVFIDTDKNVSLSDGIIKVVVRSKYTFGKSVKGKATVTINCPKLSSLKLTEKTIEVDGKGTVEFDMTKDLNLTPGRGSWPPLDVNVTMVEELTGTEQKEIAEIMLHAKPYRIDSVCSSYEYTPGKPVVYEVAIKKLDGSPLQDTQNSVKLLLEQTDVYRRQHFGCGFIDEPETEYSLVFDEKLNAHGIAKFEFTLPEDVSCNFSVRCVYLDSMVKLPNLFKETPLADTHEHLKLIVNTKKPELGKEISVDIKSRESISYFAYVVVARGTVLKTEVVKLSGDKKSHTIKFPVTYSMLPKIGLMVYNIAGNDFHFDETTIDIEGDFKNSIGITAQDEAQPGENVNLQINTDPGSFIGLLGVDQSVLLLKTGNDLSKEDIFNSFTAFQCETPSSVDTYSRYPGRICGLVTLTNAICEDHYMRARMCRMKTGGLFASPAAVAFGGMNQSVQLESLESISAPLGANFDFVAPIPPPTIRKDFLENWIFENIEDSGNSVVNLSKKIPDTITSWVITAFSLNYDTGIALTKSPTTIKTFRPFFISTDLPYSIKRGEIFSVPVIIFNYMDSLLEATVTLENTDDEFEFTDEVEAEDKTKRIKHISVGSNIGEAVTFSIRPKKLGNITLKITAISPLAGDAIHKELKVEPEGITIYKNHDYYLHTEEKSPDFTYKTELDIPSDIVVDSEYIEVSVMGDIFGSTISNMDNLIRMPYGCGEQNMINFVPNILVLKYLESVNQLTPTIEEKAKQFMNIGYQRELTYKHDNGSYSAFGKSDRTGSTWLTAYVMRSFHQAAKYIDIDKNILKTGLQFLAGTQAENGSFVENGRLFDFSHQEKLGLSAFVLLAFLENVEYIKDHEKVIEHGFKYLRENANGTSDIYTLAIAVYAMQLHKEDKVDNLLALLDTRCKAENGLKWWSKSEASKDKFCCTISNDVEITSYILMTLLDRNEFSLPISKWLISQRNSNGGFSSSQDTVLGLEALIKFAEKSGAGKPDFNINFSTTTDANNEGKFEVNKDNALVLQSQKVPNGTRSVTFNGKGTGAVILQISYRYNILQCNEKPSFKLSTELSDTKLAPGKLVVKVAVEYIPPPFDNKSMESNMVVMEASLPSGYTALTDSFDKIKNVSGVKRVESKNGDTVIVIYFESLKASDSKTVPIEAIKAHEVSELKATPIVVYDYYNSEKRATEFYQI